MLYYITTLARKPAERESVKELFLFLSSTCKCSFGALTRASAVALGFLDEDGPPTKKRK